MAKAKRPPQTRKKLGGPRVDGGPRRDKLAAVDAVQSRLEGATAVVLTEYRGMTVGELAQLRESLRSSGGEYKIYKNTLATIAARNLGLDELTTHFEGPTAFAFGTGDPVELAKKLADFAKKVPTLVLKGGILDRKVLSAKDVNALSSLESREIMLAKAAGMFLSPIQQLANLLAAGFNQMGAVLVQLRDKLPGDGAPAEAAPAEAAQEAPAAEAPAAEAPAAEAEPEAAASGSPADEPAVVAAAEEARAEEAEADAQEAGTAPEASGSETTEG